MTYVMNYLHVFLFPFYYILIFNRFSITAAFEEALNFMNDIDIVVNNAGILDERRWEKEIAVNIVSNEGL